MRLTFFWRAGAVIAAACMAAACSAKGPAFRRPDCDRYALAVQNDTGRDVLIYEREGSMPNQLLARALPGRTEIPVEPAATTSYSARSESGSYLPTKLVQLELICRAG